MGKIEELLVDKGLYDSINISFDDLDEINSYLSKYNSSTVDCFCTLCNEKRVFEYCEAEVHEDIGIPITISDFGKSKRTKRDIFNGFLNKRYALTYSCTRDKSHTLVFDLIVTDNQIIKIGQFPSVADLLIPEIAKYKNVLGKQFREYSKSIGLFAHGVGIGSFVYLRRIIEKLIFDKYNEVSDSLSISEDEFYHMKFDIKIEVLSDYLPSILVKNKNVYGIVSKGVHELSEEECLEMFPIVKTGIELMLDDIISEKERDKKTKEFEKFVAQKTGELKKQ